MSFWGRLFVLICLISCDPPVPLNQESVLSTTTTPLTIDYQYPVGMTPKGVKRLVVHFNQPMVALNALNAQKPWLMLSPQLTGYYEWVNPQLMVYHFTQDIPVEQPIRVKLEAGLMSELGLALVKDHEWSFVVAAEKLVPEPAVQKAVSSVSEQFIKTDWSQIEVRPFAPENTFSFQTSGLSQVSARFWLNPKDKSLVLFFQDPKRGFEDLDENQRWNVVKGFAAKANNEPENFSVPLGKVLGNRQGGLVVVQLSSDALKETPWAIHQVTDLDFHMEWHESHGLVFTKKASSGKVYPYVWVRVYDDSPQLLFEGRSDGHGRLKTPALATLLKKAKGAKQALYIMARKNDDRYFEVLDTKKAAKESSFVDVDFFPPDIAVDGQWPSFVRPGEKLEVKLTLKNQGLQDERVRVVVQPKVLHMVGENEMTVHIQPGTEKHLPLWLSLSEDSMISEAKKVFLQEPEFEDVFADIAVVAWARSDQKIYTKNHKVLVAADFHKTVENVSSPLDQPVIKEIRLPKDRKRSFGKLRFVFENDLYPASGRVLMNGTVIMESDLDEETHQDVFELPIEKLPQLFKLSFEKIDGKLLRYGFLQEVVSYKLAPLSRSSKKVSLQARLQSPQQSGVFVNHLKQHAAYELILDLFINEPLGASEIVLPWVSGFESDLGKDQIRTDFSTEERSIKVKTVHFERGNAILKMPELSQGYARLVIPVVALHAGEFEWLGAQWRHGDITLSIGDSQRLRIEP